MSATVLIAGLAVVAVIVFLVMLLRWAAFNGRQRRLASAFGRANRAAEAGTGEQGRPYLLYTRQVWDR